MLEHPLFSLEPIAPATGPFARQPFLSTWWKHRASDAQLMFGESGQGLVIGVRDDGVVSLAGEGDLTDYHSPLGSEGAVAVAALVAELPPSVVVVFDSLPEEAATVVMTGVEQAGRNPARSSHAMTAVVDLPSEFSTYLEMIGKKERHELRRKRRRYEETHGHARHHSEIGCAGLFNEFVRLHRLAPGDKGGFLTGELTHFFSDLAMLSGWRTDALLLPSGEAAAAVFGYEDEDGYYLYNSAYDPGLAEASPGVVLIGMMIEKAIERGVTRFDFLKGEESYKFRLGALPRLLYEVKL